MIFKKIDFDTQNGVYMDAYLYEDAPELPKWKTRPAVVICPGGGYKFCSKREADPIAMKYSSAGYNTFVLYYSLNEHSAFPNSLIDLSKAMAHIRKNANTYGVDTEKIAVCGFSAGGHLTASLATLWNNSEIQKLAGVSGDENRPNAIILGYPVITLDWFSEGEKENLKMVSKNLTDDQTEQYHNCHKNNGEHTPPAFLFHTVEDTTVPVTDSLTFATEMVKKKRPVELHIFPYGDHGCATATMLTGWEIKNVDVWMQLSINWLNHEFNFPN